MTFAHAIHQNPSCKLQRIAMVYIYQFYSVYQFLFYLFDSIFNGIITSLSCWWIAKNYKNIIFILDLKIIKQSRRVLRLCI